MALIPEQTWTAGQIGERLARAIGNDNAGFYARQVRGWAQAELFFSGHVRLGTGPTAPIAYGAVDLVAARIYSFLTAFGLNVRQLGEARGAFMNMDRPTWEAELDASPHGSIREGIHHVTDRIKAGDGGWLLKLRLDARGDILENRPGAWSKQSADANPSWASHGQLIVDVSRICRGLFDPAAEGEEA